MAGLSAPLHRELPVVAVEKAGSNYTILTFSDPEMASLCAPGHFFQLKASGRGQKNRLYKPISVYDVCGYRLSFMIKNLGAGSAALCDLKAGDNALLTGPLGNTFPLPDTGSLILVSGGVGYPPLAFLKKRLGTTVQVLHIHGGACREDVFPCDIPCTQDGSVGIKGMVTDALIQHLEQADATMICTCGPLPMLKAVQNLAREHGIPHFASLEAYMACGIGVCHGCSIPCGTDGGYELVCHDGPVFDAYRIRWEEL